jgi:hypothetical protein
LRIAILVREMIAFKIRNRRDAYSVLLRLIFVTVMGFQIHAAHAQDHDQGSRDQGNQDQGNESSVVNHRWVNEPSAGLAARLGHWRLQFMLGDRTNAPDKGIFPSSSPTQGEGAVHIVSDFASPQTMSIRLTPVAERTRYVPPIDGRTDPGDKAVTKEIVDILGSPEVTSFIAARHLDRPQLDVGKNLAVALVQDFYAALREANKKEHVWSINWRVDNGYGNADYAGYEAWGLFTEEGGVLKPFYLVGDESSGETPSATYYYILATGDLDGDGIDELITRQMVFESEEDDIEILAWENGAPVWINGFPAWTNKAP